MFPPVFSTPLNSDNWSFHPLKRALSNRHTRRGGFQQFKSSFSSQTTLVCSRWLQISYMLLFYRPIVEFPPLHKCTLIKIHDWTPTMHLLVLPKSCCCVFQQRKTAAFYVASDGFSSQTREREKKRLQKQSAI